MPHTFVLVHGAWHGGWCWRRVADILERQGHKVFTPTLTGLGERSHLMRAGIDVTPTGLRLREIAEVFGLTESRICQIHAQAVLAIKSHLQKYDPYFV